MSPQMDLPTVPSANGPAPEATLQKQYVSALEEKLIALSAKFTTLEEKFDLLEKKEAASRDGQEKPDADGSLIKISRRDTAKEPQETKEKEDGPVSRAKVVISEFDASLGSRKDTPQIDVKPEPVVGNQSTAFILRKFVEKGESQEDAEVDIVSPDLLDLLKTRLEHYPIHDPSTIECPYECLIHNWDELTEASKESSTSEADQQARSDLALLLDTITNGSGDSRLDRHLKTREANKLQRLVSFETLWTLFPPGTLVYGRPFLGQDQVFVATEPKNTWPRGRDDDDNRKWTLGAMMYDWDGRSFKRRKVYLKIPSFEGYKAIDDLPFFPLVCHPDESKLRQTLIKRGGAYKKLCDIEKPRMYTYEGLVVLGSRGFSGLQKDDDEDSLSFSDDDLDPDEDRPSNDEKVPAEKIESRVMVDFGSYFQYGPSTPDMGGLPSGAYLHCVCSTCMGKKDVQNVFRTRFDKNGRKEWEDEQYLLSPPRVLGYVLQRKHWAQFSVDSLKPLPKDNNREPWSRVKLWDGDKTKDMILNLVKGHGTSGSEDYDNDLNVDDIVVNKGKGLVFLLYGPPGVGKTSTAETVAIAARKPLFPISVADVGTKAKHVEANLAKLFALASSWQAILLIDEADVFLQSRSRGHMSSTEGNALVSVFLRVLEYYSGILMLTTNQIANFDIAVHSRIHIAIKYSKLSRDQTEAIFDGFLEPLARKGCVQNLDEIREWIKDSVCDKDLDGRQIRNVVTSALGLARAAGRSKLKKSDLRTVQDNVHEFKKDLSREYEKYRNSQETRLER